MSSMLACCSKCGAARGHDVSAGINRIATGARLRKDAIVRLEVKTTVSDFTKRFLEQLPRFDFVEELEKNDPEKYFFLRLLPTVDDLFDQKLTDAIGGSISVREFEFRQNAIRRPRRPLTPPALEENLLALCGKAPEYVS